MKHTTIYLQITIMALLILTPQWGANASIFGNKELTQKDISEKRNKLKTDVAALNQDIVNISSSLTNSSANESIAAIRSLINRLKDISQRKADFADALESVIYKYPQKDQPSVKRYVEELRMGAKEDADSITALKATIKMLENK